MAVSLRKIRFIQPHVLFIGIYLFKRLFVGFWVSRRAAPFGTAPVFSFFASIASLPWHTAFSRFAPVVNSEISALASGSNCAVKPTCLRRAAYFRSLAPLKTNLFRPCLFKRHSVSQALFSAGFAVSPGFALWRYAGLWCFWPLALVQQAQAAMVLLVLRSLGGAVPFRSSRPSPNSGYPFWLLALTFRSSRPAFCGRLTSPVSPQEIALMIATKDG